MRFLSLSSSLAYNTFWFPLLSDIPIKNIWPSWGLSDVVSISKTNLWMSSYSSNPLNNLLPVCTRYCSTGLNTIISSLFSFAHGSNPPSLKNDIRFLYVFVVFMLLPNLFMHCDIIYICYYFVCLFFLFVICLIHLLIIIL